MDQKEQDENNVQITEIARGEEASAPACDIAGARLGEFSKELTWADLTKWLSEAG